MNMIPIISLYVHIPFCIKKCHYCDFLSFSHCSQEEKKQYMAALCREIESYREKGMPYQVQTIYFGGGTPSILETEMIEAILNTLGSVFNIASCAEITLEANPGTLTKEKLAAYKKMGINRLSIGMQSTKESELRLLGRVHNYDQFVAGYSMAREAGFSNINVDIMAGLPNQTLKSYEETITKVLELDPEHISAYGLIIEENTPFYENQDILNALPEEETEQKMYNLTKNLLRARGYERYEISNYAKKGHRCRHNIVYWQEKPYLGFGLGAASFFENQRFHNTNDLKHYMEHSQNWEQIRQETVWIDKKTEMEEFMFLGLRLMEGIRKSEFENRFENSMEAVYGDIIKKYKAQSLLKEEGDFIALTDSGIFVSNQIMADFLL